MRTLSYLSLPWPCTRRLIERLGQRVVVGQHRAAVAVAAERLRRKEAGGGGAAESAERAALVSRTEALRGVVEHEQAGVFCHGGYSVVIGRQAEQIDRNDGLRREARLFGGVERGGKTLGVDIEGRFVDVDENRRGADQRRHLGGGAEGEGGAEHGIARADALRHQRQHQRVGAARAGHGMAGAAEPGERGFELAHLGAEDELAMVKHALDRLVDDGSETAALRRYVDERDGRQLRVLVHR